eukprot:499539-Prymnesium_polylepis.1
MCGGGACGDCGLVGSVGGGVSGGHGVVVGECGNIGVESMWRLLKGGDVGGGGEAMEARWWQGGGVGGGRPGSARGGEGGEGEGGGSEGVGGGAISGVAPRLQGGGVGSRNANGE